MFKIGHILYMIITSCLIIFFLIKSKKLTNKKTIKKIKFIIGCILFTIMVINRATLAYYGNIYTKYSPRVTGFMMFPNSWCSVASITLSFFLIFDIKHHFICFPIWLSLFGGIMATIMPTYLNEQPYFELDTITSLLFHSIIIFSSLFLLVTKEYMPKPFDFLEFTLGMLIITCVGYIEKIEFNYEFAMQVNEPFITSNHILKKLSSNYSIIVATSLFVAFVNYIIFRFEEKKSL